MIPPEEQAIEFGQAVGELITSDYRGLVREVPEPLRLVRLQYQQDIESRVPSNVALTHWMPISKLYRAATDMELMSVQRWVGRIRAAVSSG